MFKRLLNFLIDINGPSWRFTRGGSVRGLPLEAFAGNGWGDRAPNITAVALLVLLNVFFIVAFVWWVVFGLQ